MAYEKLAKLVRLLRDRTKSGQLTWEATADEQTFQVAFPEYVVQINDGSFVNEEEERKIEMYTVSILNEKNIRVDEVHGYDLDENLGNGDEILKEIYTIAKRQALGAERAVDTLLEVLERDEPLPPKSPKFVDFEPKTRTR